MIQANYITTTYNYDGKYLVDIIVKKDEQCYEAWLYNKDYGVKDLMFGVPMDENTKSEREFLTLVLNNIQEHINLYEEEYEDELADF